jgi:hypothetical protein
LAGSPVTTGEPNASTPDEFLAYRLIWVVVAVLAGYAVFAIFARQDDLGLGSAPNVARVELPSTCGTRNGASFTSSTTTSFRAS